MAAVVAAAALSFLAAAPAERTVHVVDQTGSPSWHVAAAVADWDQAPHVRVVLDRRVTAATTVVVGVFVDQASVDVLHSVRGPTGPMFVTINASLASAWGARYHQAQACKAIGQVLRIPARFRFRRWRFGPYDNSPRADGLGCMSDQLPYPFPDRLVHPGEWNLDVAR